MLYSSRITISHILPCAEYSANNAFNYNGNNGNLNNNNKNNTNNSRALLELDGLQASLESQPFPISEFYSVYRQTRQHKANKPSHLLFRLDYPRHLWDICRKVNEMDYQPTTSIGFIITNPRVREVIAADFSDRVVQTLLVREILPHLEEVEHPHSYSYRVGKGCLAAVQRLQELNDKYKDGYVCFLDLANHFMSIDTELWTPRVQAFIDEHYEAGDRCEILKYLADRIYRHRPGDDFIRKSPIWMWKLLPARKSLLPPATSLPGRNPASGVPIGNVTSQALSNFVTTGYLNFLDEAGFEFSFYTDDVGIFSEDKGKLLSYIPLIREHLWEDAHLKLHPDKLYFQEVRKGFNALGFRIKRNNITPSKRLVHNFKRLVGFLLLLVEDDVRNLYLYRDTAMQRLNSTLSILAWSHSYNIRQEQLARLQESKWEQIFTFHESLKKVTIKPSKTRRAYFFRRNRLRKQQSLKYYTL